MFVAVIKIACIFRTVQRYLAVMEEYLKDGQDDFISDVAGFCGVHLVNR